MYLVNEVSKISGVSVRTLHYYDKIKLLSPQKADNGYRYYSDEDMASLQTILFYKYLGFSLQQIKDLLPKTDGEKLSHLKRQLLLMQSEKKKLLTLITTLEKTIRAEERKITMSTKEKFTGFSYQDNLKYKQEAIDKYGKEAVETAISKQKGKEEELTEGFNQIFFAFADNKEKNLTARDKENIKLASKLHQHICQYTFDCTAEVFAKIGLGYVQNPEFKQNLDKFGSGTAEYVSAAIQAYTKNL